MAKSERNSKRETRSADFQSAVSPICNRQGADYIRRTSRLQTRGTADCTSALQARTLRSMDARSLVVTMLRWFAQNARDLPWRRTTDPYAIWVSEIMLQQTQVKTVLRYWDRWMRALPDVAALAKASSDKIHKLWEGLGYYTRVRNMQRAAQVILASHAGQFPMAFAEVLELPGIGRYTAGAICSIAFDQPT